MRNAQAVLEIIQKRGKKGLPLGQIYRQLYNPELYLLAYSKLYANDGAMTPGVTGETVDQMSLRKIDAIIDALKAERYRWQPVRRTHIPKKKGGERPLGMPGWTDKLLQEVIRMILEAYYEPRFSVSSHGFRPQLGCHTALLEIEQYWTGTKWFIEGDISKYFDTIDHDVLMNILGEKITDKRFLGLIEKLLKAGYLEDWTYHLTMSGTPQGGIVSPILANIYLDRFDKFVEQHIIPNYTKGEKRGSYAPYSTWNVRYHRLRKQGKREEAKRAKKQRDRYPSQNPQDPDYRRLRYIRYADDFLLGFIGSKEEAEEIKTAIGKFLREELHLELSQEKTLITNANENAAKFLGYEIVSKKSKTHKQVNGAIGLRIPKGVVDEKCAEYVKKDKISSRPELEVETDLAIVTNYQMKFRGLVQYYILADNVFWLNRLEYYARYSLLKTLAEKHGRTFAQTYRKYAATVVTASGTKKRCLEARVEREGKEPLIARFGGIPLRKKQVAVLNDAPLQPWVPRRSELLKRLLAERCELCESTEQVEVHHIRKMADLQTKGRRGKPLWVVRMAEINRKTLVLCRACHEEIHSGTSKQQFRLKSLESRVR